MRAPGDYSITPATEPCEGGGKRTVQPSRAPRLSHRKGFSGLKTHVPQPSICRWWSSRYSTQKDQKAPEHV